MNCILCNSQGKSVYQQTSNNYIVKCLRCGLLFVDPLPTKEQLKEYYLKTYKDTEIPYLLKYKDQTIKRAAKILNIVRRFKKSGYLLDVGCGYGFFMDAARKEGYEVLGIELLPAAADFARQNFGLEVVMGEVTEANLREKSFDLISLQHTLEHLLNPLDTLSNLKKALKDDGILVIVVPNASSLMARWAKINWLCLDERTHLFHYNKSSLKKLLSKSGFNTLLLKTWQWDTRELLWALKVLMRGHRSSGRNINIDEDKESKYTSEKKCSFLKNIIVKMAYPFSWIAQILGLGEEIIVFAKKEL